MTHCTLARLAATERELQGCHSMVLWHGFGNVNTTVRDDAVLWQLTVLRSPGTCRYRCRWKAAKVLAIRSLLCQHCALLGTVHSGCWTVCSTHATMVLVALRAACFTLGIFVYVEHGKQLAASTVASCCCARTGGTYCANLIQCYAAFHVMLSSNTVFC